MSREPRVPEKNEKHICQLKLRKVHVSTKNRNQKSLGSAKKGLTLISLLNISRSVVCCLYFEGLNEVKNGLKLNCQLRNGKFSVRTDNLLSADKLNL